MSTSPARPNGPPPRPDDAAAERALHYWRQRLQGPSAAARPDILHHARQALHLAARRGARAEALLALVQALHPRIMAQGWVHTWATDLQRLLQQRPDLLTGHAPLQEYLLMAWTAAGHWERAHAILRQWQRAAPGRDASAAARLLYRQGNLLWMEGHWPQALRLARQAWRLVPPHDRELRIAVSALLVLAAWRLGHWRQALVWGQHALQRCAPDDHLWRGRLHHYLFLTTIATAPHQARQHLARALAHLQAAGNQLHLAHVWADSTNLHLMLREPARAEEALARAYALWRQIEDPAGLADYYRHAAIVAHALSRFHEAQALIAHAAERWAALSVGSEVRRCQHLLHRWRQAA